MLTTYIKNARTTLPADLVAGTVYGLIMLLQAVTLVALIFGQQELEAVIGLGMRAILMSFVVMNVIVALTSSYYFATSGPASSYSALLAVSVAEIVAVLSLRHASPTEIGTTVLVTLAVSACVDGIVLLFLGLIRGGRLARHIPYPVSGGFLVGSGFLVFAGGYRVLTGNPLTWQGLGSLPQVPALSLVTAVVVAVAMLVFPRFTRHYLVLPGIMLGGVVFFYLGYFLTDLSLDSARAQGMLFRPVDAASTPLPPYQLLSQVQWDVLIGQLSGLLAVAVVVVLGVSLSAANLETATLRDADFDRELRSNGLANIATGVVGGVAGGMNSGLTLVMRRAGAATRFAGVWASALCFIALMAFVPVLFYFPKPVLAGLLLGVGAGLLRDWLWSSFAKLPRAEYALIWAIFILIVSFGLVPGVALGLIAAGLLFVYRYGQTQVVRHSVASSVHLSSKERSMAEVEQLKEAGKHAWTLTLQGYIFFGTASEVVDACRQLVEHDEARYLILDFRLVQGIDVSAAEAFVRLAQVCARARSKLILSGVHADVLNLLRKSKLVLRQGWSEGYKCFSRTRASSVVNCQWTVS
jgi:SulP family sulfate permease